MSRSLYIPGTVLAVIKQEQGSLLKIIESPGYSDGVTIELPDEVFYRSQRIIEEYEELVKDLLTLMSKNSTRNND